MPKPLLSVAHKISYELPLLSTYAVPLLEGQLKLAEAVAEEPESALKEVEEVGIDVVEELAGEMDGLALPDQPEDGDIEEELVDWVLPEARLELELPAYTL